MTLVYKYRSKSEERLVERDNNFNDNSTSRIATSSGCGTGSSSAGESTSSSSPGVPSGIEGHTTKDGLNDAQNAEQQGMWSW